MKKLLLTLVPLIITCIQAQNKDLDIYFSSLSSPVRLQYDINQQTTYLTESTGISFLKENPTTFELEKQLLYELDQSRINEVFLDDFYINETDLYFVQVKETSSGPITSEIRKIDLSNTTVLPIVESDTELVYSVTSNTDFIGFGIHAIDEFLFFIYNEFTSARLERIDLSDTFPVTSTTTIATGFGDADDMDYASSNLYISDENQIIKVENPQSDPINISTSVFASGFSNLKGIYVDISGTLIYAADGNQIKRAELNTSSSNFVTVVVNETFPDNFGGGTFYSNFNDVIIADDLILGSLNNSGLIVSSEELLFNGLERPNYLEIVGSKLYVQDTQNIYASDLNRFPTMQEVIYTASGEDEISDFSINGDNLYITVFEDPNGTLTSKIIKLDLSNLNATPQTILSSTTTFFNLPIQVANDLFFFEFVSDGAGDFNTTLKKANLDGSNPQLISRTPIFFPTDIDFNNGKLYFSTEPKNENLNDPRIIEVDITSGEINLIQTFPGQDLKGIDISENNLFIAVDDKIQKANLADSTLTFETLNLTSGQKDYTDLVVLPDPVTEDEFDDTTIYTSLADENQVIEVFILNDDVLLSTNNSPTKNNEIKIYIKSGTISIRNLDKPSKAIIYDISGKPILSKNISFDNNTISIETFPKDMYVLALENYKGFKFVKN